MKPHWKLCWRKYEACRIQIFLLKHCHITFLLSMPEDTPPFIQLYLNQKIAESFCLIYRLSTCGRTQTSISLPIRAETHLLLLEQMTSWLSWKRAKLPQEPLKPLDTLRQSRFKYLYHSLKYNNQLPFFCTNIISLKKKNLVDGKFLPHLKKSSSLRD